uniref:cGMP-dependent protein kinase n=1 Tax=Timema monikensis TaxID=170555 RepID=A0A7R9EAI5_9NEOP|nr:unnamed protein product [Timema monikensis]
MQAPGNDVRTLASCDHLYVSAEGQFEVHKQGNVLGSFGSGRVFGELALLYKVKRNASIRATTQAKVWVLNREVFKQVIISSSIQETKEKIKYLRSVPLPILKQLSDDNLEEMASFLVVKLYATGTKIVEQDENGDEFFIITGGSVRITKRVPGSLEQEDCGVLVRGDYFGEQALVHQVPRQATITALAPGVECLVLERGPFEKCFGGIQELKVKKYPSMPSHQPKQMYLDVNLKDLLYVATLGVGGFGRVKLVQHRTNKKLTFAIKCLKKQYVVEQQQVQHAYNEKLAMLECAECPFIVRLYRTYKDSKYVYYLMEPCLGGDLFTTLQRYKKFQEETVRFVVGCAVEALQFLHHRGFIYRDLKPENLLLDSTGYVKLTDFGFAKRIGTSGKTWTFAGTPDYTAPEVVLNTRGYDRAVDYWGLGILIYELLNGSPPFRASDPSKTYKLIMQGFQSSRFPKEISKDAKDLIKRLCNLISTERLGYQRNGIQDIRDHRWFKKFDWESLKKKRLPTPLLPQVTSNTDTQNFDPYGEDKAEPPEENSGWDKDF